MRTSSLSLLLLILLLTVTTNVLGHRQNPRLAKRSKRKSNGFSSNSTKLLLRRGKRKVKAVTRSGESNQKKAKLSDLVNRQRKFR